MKLVGNVLVATVVVTGAGLVNSSPASIIPALVVARACFVLFRLFRSDCVLS